MCRGPDFLRYEMIITAELGGRGSYSISFSQPYAIVRLHFMNFKLSDLGNILDVANHGSNSGFKLTKLRLKQIIDSCRYKYRTFCPEVKLGDWWSLPHL
jgi:hypothetical protein